MAGVNKQLALFFKQVGMRSYLRKSIAVILVVFVLIAVNADVMLILLYFIEINKIYYYVASWLNSIMNFSVYLSVTLVFYYFADFGFEARTIR